MNRLAIKDENVLSKNTVHLSEELSITFSEAILLKQSVISKYLSITHWKSLPAPPRNFASNRNITFGESAIENMFGGMIPSHSSINIFGLI